MLDEIIIHEARQRRGLVLAADLGSSPGRSASRNGLVLVQPRVYAARSQPISGLDLVQAVRLSARRDDWAFLGATALWLHGAGPPPSQVEVGVPDGQRLHLLPPVVARRVAPAVLHGAVTRWDCPVVRLEIATVQVVADCSASNAVRLVEDLLRTRVTTAGRLRDACRRGLEGSAVLRTVLSEVTHDGAEARQRRLVRALRAAGVTGLRTEVRLTSASGATAYLDALHLASRRALEVDGAASHGSSSQQLVDRRRDRWVLREHRVETLRVTAGEVDRDLPGLVRELVPMFNDPALPFRLPSS